MRLTRWLIMMILGLGGTSSWAGPQTMSVQVRDGQLRSTPSFFGERIGELHYGDQVRVLESKGVWYNVYAQNQSGWMHQSALTKKKIVIKAGAEDVGQAASSEELALAGKGFNAEVEAEFKAKHPNMDFTWVDKMEDITISSDQMRKFLEEGEVLPTEENAP